MVAAEGRVASAFGWATVAGETREPVLAAGTGAAEEEGPVAAECGATAVQSPVNKHKHMHICKTPLFHQKAASSQRTKKCVVNE